MTAAVMDASRGWVTATAAAWAEARGMEAETIALAACCRELFPMMDMVSSVTKSVKLTIKKTTMNISIYEDNLGALLQAKTLPPQFTP